MSAIYVTKGNGGFSAPINGTPSSFAALYRNLRDDGLIEIFGGELGAGRRISPAAITAASTTLRLVPRSPLKFGEVKAVYGGTSSAGISWPDLNCAAMEGAANSIAAVAALGGVRITGGNGRYIATFNKVGAVTSLTFAGLSAVPDVYSRTSTVTAGDGSTKAVQLIEIEPAAIQFMDTDDWTAIAAPTLSATVTAGSSTSPEITVIAFDKAPAGGEWTATNATWQTAGISVFASAQQVEDAFNKVAGGSRYRVRKPALFRWEVMDTILGNSTNITVEDAGVLAHVGVYGLTDWRAIQKFGFDGSGHVKARAIYRVTFASGQVVDGEEDVEISLASAPAVAQVLTSSNVPSNLIGNYPASQSIAASRFVQIYDDAGTDRIRAASAANSYDADGWIVTAVASGNSVDVYGTTGTLTGLSGRTTGLTQYLSEAGAVTESAPTVGIRQDLGEATSDGSMSVDIQTPVIL